MSIKNQYKLDIDTQRKYSGVIPTFTDGDNNELLISVVSNNKYLDLSGVDKVVASCIIDNKKLIQVDGEIVNNIGHLAISINVNKLTLPVGTSSLKVILLEGHNRLTLPDINIVIKEDESNIKKDVIGTLGGIIVTGYPIAINSNETILNKNDTDKLLKSVNEVTKVLNKKWADCIAEIENENKVEIKEDKKLDINLVPLQLLTKINSNTSNKDIKNIVSIIKNLNHYSFDTISKEGIELLRIEAMLEDRIINEVNEDSIVSLANTTLLLRSIKEMHYNKSSLSIANGASVGGKIN